MKRFFVPLFSVLCLTTGIAFAEDPAPTPEPAPAPETVPTDGSCKKLVDACKAAGFVKGAHKTGKGLFKDCMEPLLAGKTVEGVTVDAADVTACKAQPRPKQK